MYGYIVGTKTSVMMYYWNMYHAIHCEQEDQLQVPTVSRMSECRQSKKTTKKTLMYVCFMHLAICPIVYVYSIKFY